MIEQWLCDLDIGYRLVLSSVGGSFETAASGPVPYYVDVIPPGMDMLITLDCIDLPSAILFHGGAEGMQISLYDEGLPPFAVWAPYYEELMITPWFPADTTGLGFATDVPNIPVLIRIPAN